MLALLLAFPAGGIIFFLGGDMRLKPTKGSIAYEQLTMDHPGGAFSFI
jgi:hypothetical protein